MEKIILNFGLFIFCISLAIFSQKGMFIQDVLIKSFIIFFVVTIMLTILAILFVKAINKASIEKAKRKFQSGNIIGNSDNEE